MIKEFTLYKLNKVDYTVVISYREISLLKNLNKVCEKLVAYKLINLYEVHYVLYEGQIS